jgi:hypothetical protein
VERRQIGAAAIRHVSATHSASYAGLTRVSITLQKSLSKKMDCRVEPGNDARSRVRDAVLCCECPQLLAGDFAEVRGVNP